MALLEAKRIDAIQQVAQLDSELSASRAEDARLIAEESYAKSVHDEEQAIYKQEATTERLYLDAIQKYKAAQAARERGVAQTHKAEQAVAARIGEEHVLVAEVAAQLADAKLNLEWTRVVSPANGYVTNVQLREGSYIHVGVPVLTCIDGDAWWIVANYRENSLENIRPGQRVGLTFNTYPGRVFPGVVQTVGWGVDEGQSGPSGSLPTIQEPKKSGFGSPSGFQVRITPQLPDNYPLRVGATAAAVVYTSRRPLAQRTDRALAADRSRGTRFLRFNVAWAPCPCCRTHGLEARVTP